MFMLMNIGLKLIVSRASLQLFLCSLWSGQIVILKPAFSIRVAARHLSDHMELHQE